MGILVAQCLALVLLAGVSVCQALLGLNHHVLLAAIVFVLAAFLIFWPFRGSSADRAISAIIGVCSLALAVASLGDTKFDPVIGNGAGTPDRDAVSGMIPRVQVGSILPYGHWASAFVVLLIMLTVVCFARQMARQERSHLVRALSHSITSGVAAASLPGWAFLPRVIEQFQQLRATGVREAALVVVMCIAVAVVLILIVSSALWWIEPDPDEQIVAPWIGFGLVAVLFAGIIVYGVGLAVVLIGW